MPVGAPVAVTVASRWVGSPLGPFSLPSIIGGIEESEGSDEKEGSDIPDSDERDELEPKKSKRNESLGAPGPPGTAPGGGGVAPLGEAPGGATPPGPAGGRALACAPLLSPGTGSFVPAPAVGGEALGEEIDVGDVEEGPRGCCAATGEAIRRCDESAGVLRKYQVQMERLKAE